MNLFFFLFSSFFAKDLVSNKFIVVADTEKNTDFMKFLQENEQDLKKLKIRVRNFSSVFFFFSTDSL